MHARSPCCGTTEMQVSASIYGMLHVISYPHTDYSSCVQVYITTWKASATWLKFIYLWHFILWGSMHWLCIACFCILSLCTDTATCTWWLQVVDFTKADYGSPLPVTCISWLSLLHCAAVLSACYRQFAWVAYHQWSRSQSNLHVTFLHSSVFFWLQWLKQRGS